VRKDHARVTAYGELDEANAAIGAALATCQDGEFRAILSALSHELFDIGAVLSTPPEAADTLQKRMDLPLSQERIGEMERTIDRLDVELAPLKTFLLPGGTPLAASLHVARASVRRAERATVALMQESTVPELILIYLNRLSDLLFTLARLANTRAGLSEPLWQPRRPNP
jgi:cob(I)alamin adenosyltransferase